MTSPRIIASVLAYLHELYPSRDISAATSEAWSMTFREWGDERLMDAARIVAAEPGRKFFPTPGEIAAAGAVETIVDHAKILRQIEKLSVYTPQAGMIAPNVQLVRDTYGNAVADAYAAAGAARCFADDDTSRSISTREFQKALDRFVAAPAQDRPLLKSGDDVRQLQRGSRRGSESVGDVVKRALPPGTAA